MVKISYVIPCYRSERTIGSVIESIHNVMRNKNEGYEIVLVNDCSPDAVWEYITNIAEKDEKVIGVNLIKNFGQHGALMAGYRIASGDIIVSMDDDGQTPVEEVYKLISELKNGNDVVFAEYDEIKQNGFRRLGSKINEIMVVKMLDKPKNIKVTSFFVAHKYIIDEIIKYDGPYPYICGLILRTTKKISNVKVHHHERISGESGYNIASLLNMWMNGFTAFSIKPLRIATLLGFISAFSGFIYTIYIVIHKFVNPNVPLGYSSIMGIILLVSGIIMLLLGMIGEYLGRIYLFINGTPQYIIKEIKKKES